MATPVVIPSLGLTMEEAVIVEWLGKEGQEVKKDDIIVLIDTDKATAEVEAPVSGILADIRGEPGDAFPVGEPIAAIYTAEEYAAIGKAADPAAQVSAEQAGAQAAAESAEPAEAPRQAMDFYTLEEEGAAGEPAWKSRRTASPPPAGSTGAAGSRPAASPAARKAARERRVPLETVRGSGPNGRILHQDVIAYAERNVPAAAYAGAGGPGGESAGTTEAFSRMRRTIADRMLASSRETAPVTIFTRVRMDEAVKLRAQMNGSSGKREGVIIPYDAIFVKACAMALVEHPELQAQWTAEGLRHPAGVHIGVAVSLPGGLVVPVVRDGHAKSLFEIAGDIVSLCEQARSGKLGPERMSGGTFTVSNLGMYPVDGFTPVINQPEAAILGIGSIREEALVENGAIIVGRTTTLSLTFDHRIADGAPAAAFLARVRDLAERPYQLFM